MFFSTQCQYALRAVYEIAHADPGQLMTIEEIATAQQVPQRYLEGILNQLRKGDLLEAQRGRSGGYRLSRDSDAITIGDIVRAIDGPARAVECVTKTKASNCPMPDTCVFRSTWRKVQTAIDHVLDSTSFSQLLEMEREAQTRGVTDYAI